MDSMVKINAASLTTVKNELDTTKADLATTKADLATTKADLATTKADLATAITDLNAAKVLVNKFKGCSDAKQVYDLSTNSCVGSVSTCSCPAHVVGSDNPHTVLATSTCGQIRNMSNNPALVGGYGHGAHWSNYGMITTYICTQTQGWVAINTWW